MKRIAKGFPSGSRRTMMLMIVSALFAVLAATPRAHAQDEKTPVAEIYGFIMTDIIQQFKQNDPAWFDVIRPTKLPAYKNQFGADGHTFFSVRQTRFGVRNYFQTSMGELKTQFEFEMFGTGVDAGQTTIRLRHAYGELGKIGVGQTWSPFMDIDVFPNTVEYWGPTGMAFFRNVQIRYMPIKGPNRLTIALERPGASADQGDYAGRVELSGVRPKLDVPDLSAEYRYGAKKWGYVELAGIARRLNWEDIDSVGDDLSDSKLGWGVSLSSGINLLKKDVLHLQLVMGEGVQNYMNDAPADVGINSLGGSKVEGVALPLMGIVAFLDHYWSDRFSTSLGYSSIDIDNSNGQAANAFKKGQYAIINLLYYPVTNVMAGLEVQYGKRDNFKDGFSSEDYRIQFSFRYNFSQKFFRNKDSND